MHSFSTKSRLPRVINEPRLEQMNNLSFTCVTQSLGEWRAICSIESLADQIRSVAMQNDSYSVCRGGTRRLFAGKVKQRRLLPLDFKIAHNLYELRSALDLLENFQHCILHRRIRFQINPFQPA